MAVVIKIKYENNLRRLVMPGQVAGEDLSFAKLEGKIRELFQLPSSEQLVLTYTDKDGDVVIMANDQDVEDALVHQALNPLRVNVTLQPKSSTGPGQTKAEKDTTSDAGGPFAGGPFAGGPFKLPPEFTKPLFEGMAYPAQIPGIVENLMQSISSQVASVVKNGMAAAASSVHTEYGTGPAAPKDTSAQKTPTESANAENVVHNGVGCDLCDMIPIVGIRWKSIRQSNYDLCNTCFEKHGNVNEYSRIDQPMFRPRHFHGPYGVGPHGAFRGGFSSMRPSYGGRSFGMRGPHGQGGRNCPGMGGFAGKLDARFVRDVTMFDGTEVAPKTPFTKIWRLRNNGSVPWPQSTSLVFIGGDEMGEVSTVPLEIPERGLAPEEEIEVSVDLVAPERPGRYISNWRLVSPAGPKFGHRIWVHVQVVPKESLDMPAVLKEENVRESEVRSTVQTEVQDVPAAESGGVGSIEPKVTEAGETAVVQDREVEKDIFATEFGDFGAVQAAVGGTKVQDSDVRQDDTPTGSSDLNTIQVETGNTSVTTLADSKGEPFFKLADESSAVPPVASTITEERIRYPVVDQGLESPLPGDLLSSNPQVVDFVTREENLSVADSPTQRKLLDQDELSARKASLLKLEAMGFTDSELNLELLNKNRLDLRKTLDDLCAAEEWDPILEELEEMGFYDTSMNRRLMFKNNGSVKLVVKDLVQMYKDPKGKATAE